MKAHPNHRRALKAVGRKRYRDITRPHGRAFQAIKPPSLGLKAWETFVFLYFFSR